MKRMFSDEQVREIRQGWFEFQLTQKEIAQLYECNPRTISRIINRETYANVRGMGNHDETH